MIKTCIRCGKNFDISEAELGFYEERGLAVPDMCYSCRRQERIRRNAPVVPKGAGGSAGEGLVLGGECLGFFLLC